MQHVEYQKTDITGIERIRPLWIQLNRHHYANARAFQGIYARWTFDDRKAYFTTVAQQGSLRIDLAFDPERGGMQGIVSARSRKTGPGRSNRSVLTKHTGCRALEQIS